MSVTMDRSPWHTWHILNIKLPLQNFNANIAPDQASLRMLELIYSNEDYRQERCMTRGKKVQSFCVNFLTCHPYKGHTRMADSRSFALCLCTLSAHLSTYTHVCYFTLQILTLNPSNAEANFVQSTKMQNSLKTSSTLSCWYSLDSPRWALADEYPFARVSIIFRFFA